MKDKNIVLLLCILISNIIYSQDFSFTWNAYPSLAGRLYAIKIIQDQMKREITLNEGITNITKTKKINKSDCERLYAFISTYDFPNKRNNTIYGPTYREYVDFKQLPDSNWVIFNNDTIRRSYLVTMYQYDKELNKYYNEFQKAAIYYDGISFEGEFNAQNEHEIFSIYLTRITDTDYELNGLIYSLVEKYFKKKHFPYLGDMIEKSFPRSDINK